MCPAHLVFNLTSLLEHSLRPSLVRPAIPPSCCTVARQVYYFSAGVILDALCLYAKNKVSAAAASNHTRSHCSGRHICNPPASSARAAPLYPPHHHHHPSASPKWCRPRFQNGAANILLCLCWFSRCERSPVPASARVTCSS